MYKILIFIIKSDSDFVNYFNQNFIPLLSDINGDEVKLANVESNLLLDLKYSHFCEITASSKDEMDKKLNSASGRKLGKLLMELHQKLSVINVSYE
jgi:hypothetical protein